MNYHTLDLYRNAQTPLESIGTYPWHWPGSCLTAQSVIIPLVALPLLNMVKVKWRLTWNPNIDDGTQQTAVRLCSCYDGPSNLVQQAAFFRANCTSPQNDAVDITTAFKSLVTQAIADQKDLQFTHQTVGTGTIGPLIYSSSLECVFD